MEKSFKEQVKGLDTTSKAGQLARELNAERTRLKHKMGCNHTSGCRSIFTECRLYDSR